MSDLSLTPVLELDHLSRTYPDGAVQALVDVSFSIAPGEYVAIMGPSGCGKSTLLNCIGALDKPDRGTIRFAGVPLEDWPSLDELRASRIGYVFQSFFLLPTLTALENVQVPMFESQRNSRDRVKRARELLAEVKLTHRENHLPTRLSVGERQRVAIARALANDPELILADEPTGNLDSVSSEAVLDLFDDLHRRLGKTLVTVTHSPEVAERAGRLLRMRDGKLVEDRIKSVAGPAS